MTFGLLHVFRFSLTPSCSRRHHGNKLLAVAVFIFHPLLHPGYVAVMHRKCALLLFATVVSACITLGPPSLPLICSLCQPLTTQVICQLVHSGNTQVAPTRQLLSSEGHTAIYCWEERYEDSTVFVIHHVFGSTAGSVDQRLHVPLPWGTRTAYCDPVIQCHTWARRS